MKKATPHHQQLSLHLENVGKPIADSSDQVGSEGASPAIVDPSNRSSGSPSVVLDFQSVLSKRQASDQANLYKRILDSVRHIG